MLKKDSKYYEMTKRDTVSITDAIKIVDEVTNSGVVQKALEIKDDFLSLEGEVAKQMNNMQCFASEKATEFEKIIGYAPESSRRPKVQYLDPEDYEPVEWFGNTTYSEYLDEYL